MSLHIERRSFDDPVAARLVDDLFTDLAARYGPEDDGGEGWRSEVTPEKVTPPEGTFLVATWEGEPVGCGALKRLGDGVAEVKRMYTAPAGRQRGVARAVLGRLEIEARALGYATLRLETGEAQPEAVALYDSAGWTRIAPYGRYKDDPRSICFEKRV